MSEVNIYKAATQQALRFPSQKGGLTVEQLWELPLTSRSGFDLDTTAKAVNMLLKDEAEESFVEKSTNPAKAKLELMLEIVKDVIGTKQEQAKAAAKRKANADEKARLTEVLHGKKDAALQALTPDEIQARIDALDAE
jgi:hypothetical protein